MSDMVWPFGQSNTAQQSYGTLPLGTQQPPYDPNGYIQHPQFAGGQQWGQAQQPNPMLAGMMGGAGINPQYAQQPVAPPSELEIIAMLLQTATPIDQWLAGPSFQAVLGILTNLVNLSLVEFFRNAKFTEDDEGKLILDITTLPSQYQTLSPENVTSELSSLQATSNRKWQESVAAQQNILLLAQQSMMQGMIDGALADPGFLEKAGAAVGGAGRAVLFGPGR